MILLPRTTSASDPASPVALVRRTATFVALTTLASTFAATPALGQNGDAPAPAPAVDVATDEDSGARGPLGRRLPPDELVALGFSNVAINEVFPFIAEETGKIVIPIDVNLLQTKRITLLNDSPVPRAMALDLVFEAFRLNGVGIIEREDVVIVGNIDTITTTQVPPIIPADVDISKRMDRGTLVAKFIQLSNVKASQALEILQEKELPTYAQLSADDNSNQILVYGDIALCQQIRQLIDELDERFKLPKTQTFRLAYSDAVDIQESIEQLYSESGTSSNQSSNRRSQPRGGQRGGQVQAPTPGDPVGLQIELRTTVNTQQNSVTVVGDPAVVEEIARLIETDWDLPRTQGSNRIYTLEYTDPIKIASVINELLGQASGAGGGGGARGQQGGTDVSDALAGIYQIQAFPDNNQLVVLAKTQESLDFLDGIIRDLDQPTEIGLPFVIELKHANAFELADELNALLAEAGSGGEISRPDEGLTGRSIDDEGGGGDGAGSAGTISFPWQRAGQRNDEQSPESVLIGKVRIVPISRQNALAILCPRPQTEAVKELVQYFDRPGRQVMLSVIIAEIELTNDFALGLRLSSDPSVRAPTSPDNAIGAGFNSSANRQGSGGSLFDSTVLDATLDLNVLLQALDQDTSVRVLQQPVVFTADNQEAFFFDGQEIPLPNGIVTDANGNPNQDIQYRDVGVILNARPRITAKREVDIDLRLEISAVVPGITFDGAAVLDKRETTTNVVVKNGQTIVLSGILRETESQITRKVPLLGDIPLLGELFKSRENQTVTTELVAFITPLVVDDPSENDANFQDEWRDRLEGLTRPIDEQVEEFRELGSDRWGDRFSASRSEEFENAGDAGSERDPEAASPADPERTLYDPAQIGRDRRSGAGGSADAGRGAAAPAPAIAAPDDASANALDVDDVAPASLPAPLTTAEVAVMSRDELLVRMRDLAALRAEVRRAPGRGPLADRLSLDLSLVVRRLAELDAIDRQNARAQ